MSNEKPLWYKPNIQIQFDDATKKRNAATLNHWLPVWLSHIRMNTPNIEYQRHNVDCIDAKGFEPLPERDPRHVLVLASGKSLDRVAPYLRDFNGLVIAGPTNAALCAANGRWPDIIVATDSNQMTRVQLEDIPYAENGTVLITNPTIHPTVPGLFDLNTCLWHLSIVMDEHGKYSHPYNTLIQGMFNGVIDTWMAQGGNTPMTAYLLNDCWRSNFDLKDPVAKFKPERVYLAGLDFGYPDMDTGRSSTYTYVPATKEFIKNKQARIHTFAKLVEYMDTGIITDSQMVGYKRSALFLWFASATPTWDLTHGGIVTEIPHADPAEVLTKPFDEVTLDEYGTAKAQEIYTKYIQETTNKEPEIFEEELAERSEGIIEPSEKPEESES